MKWVKTSRFLSSSIRRLWLLNASMLKIWAKDFNIKGIYKFLVDIVHDHAKCLACTYTI